MVKYSEDALGEKMDRCVADTVLKVCGGVAIGIIASAAVFRGKLFPVWFGTGVGLGMGWSNCRHDLQSPYLLHGRKIRVDDVGSESNPKSEYAVYIEPGHRES